MARIPEQFIDELISRVDIAELIGHRVPLQRAGSEFRACCPFHDEKTPSFYVSPVKQFYHCFGCGAHGTSISFLMNYDNMEFLDAIDTLAGQAGMSVPRDAQPDDHAREHHAKLHQMVEQVNRWYQAQLRGHSDAKQAIEYLKNRGLDGQTAADFQIGFAPEGWDNLIRALGDTPEKLTLLAETGLVIAKDEGGHYDRFRGRVMFPIEDYRGKLVGFGGRVLGKGEPKYLNSPETALFHKGAELYGFYRARREIGKHDEVVVVEGYMDVVGLAQCGIQNAVATLGTATTPTHMQRLFRAASKVIFCFDGDRAGRKAAWRAMQVALAHMQDGRQIKFLLIPEGEDPDSLIRAQGKSFFEEKLRDALSLDTFLFDTLTHKLDLNQMDQRAKLSTQARPLLQTLPQGNFKTMMYARLSEIVGVVQHEDQPAAQNAPIEIESIRLSSEKLAAARSKTNYSSAELKEVLPYKPVRRSLALLVQYPELIPVANEFELYVGNAIPGLELLDEIITKINSNSSLNAAQLLERLRETKYYALLSALLAVGENEILDGPENEKELREMMQALENETRQHELNRLYAKGLKNLSTQQQEQLKALLSKQATAQSGIKARYGD